MASTSEWITVFNRYRFYTLKFLKASLFYFNFFELILVLINNNKYALGNALATWSGQVHQCFYGVPYIILIYAEYTVPDIFIPLCSPPIKLITHPNRKENITALMSIIFIKTWHDCHILLVAVDISWKTRI